MKLIGRGGVLDPGQMAQDAWGGGAVATLISGLGLGKNTLSHKLANHMIENNVELTPNNINILQNQVNNDIQAFGVPKVNNEISQTNAIQPQEEVANIAPTIDTSTPQNTYIQPTTTIEREISQPQYSDDFMNNRIKTLTDASKALLKVMMERLRLRFRIS